MSGRSHRYECTVTWTGNTGGGTATYTGYQRSHLVTQGLKPPIVGSSDPAFRGNPAAWNPEELLLASLSQCHMLFFLHRAAVAGIVVVAYVDDASGTMVEEGEGGRFTEVVLRPRVVVAAAEMIGHCDRLHAEAHERCYIARSVTFPVRHYPQAEAA